MDHEGSKSATTVIAERMRDLRTQRRWSAQRLAEEMTKVGVEWNRGVVTKLENNRRESVSVTELLALALVLDVSPATLMLPKENVEYQLTARRSAPAKAVGAWITHPYPLPLADDDADGFRRKQQRYLAEWPVYLPNLSTRPETDLMEIPEYRHWQTVNEVYPGLFDHWRSLELTLRSARETYRRLVEKQIRIDPEVLERGVSDEIRAARKVVESHEELYAVVVRAIDQLARVAKGHEEDAN